MNKVQFLEFKFIDVQEYCPDQDGYYPLDYAGLFKHKETAQFLIETTLRKLKELELKVKVGQEGKIWIGP